MDTLSQEVSIHDLTMADSVRLSGVYRPPRSVLTPYARAGIGAAPAPVTAGVLILRNIVAGVDGNIHGFSVSLKCVVLGTPVS